MYFVNLSLRICEVSLKYISLASKSTFTYYGGGWDLKLRPGLTPRCSQGGWGWPPTAAWDWERGAKSGKRDNCLFCRADSFARAISRPAKAALSFYQCKIHSFFATHHSTSIHIWSSSFDTIFLLCSPK